MDIFSNKKITVLILSAVLIVLITILFIPNLLGIKKYMIINKESPEITQIKTQSGDTSLDSIRQDLDSTDLTNIDKELESIEKELNAAI